MTGDDDAARAALEYAEWARAFEEEYPNDTLDPWPGVWEDTAEDLIEDFTDDFTDDLKEERTMRQDDTGTGLGLGREEEVPPALAGMVKAIGKIYAYSFEETRPGGMALGPRALLGCMKRRAMCLDPLHPHGVAERLNRVIFQIEGLRDLLQGACDRGVFGKDNRAPSIPPPGGPEGPRQHWN